jgi:lipoprotein-releasing system permease protein
LKSFENSIAWRYLKTKKRSGFVSLTAWFSFLGITLGVATLIVVMSVMNGFRHELLSKILGMNGHLGIYSYSQNMPKTLGETFCKKIQTINHVISVNPLIERQGLLMSKGKASGAIIHGMYEKDLEKRSLIAKNLSPTTLQSFKGDVIIMGYRLAGKLGLKIGDYVTLMSPEGTPTALGVIPRTKTFYVLSVFDSQMHEYDGSFVFMPMKSCQNMFQMEDRFTGLEIFVQHPLQTQSLRKEIIPLLEKSQLYLFDWQKANGYFFSAIQIQRNVMFLILSLIILVAAFNIISSLTMLVKDKSSSIAILKTMGASNAMIQRIFFRIGTAIGFLGALFGGILGLSFACNIERIRKFLESFGSGDLFSSEIYFLSHLPARVDLLEVAFIIGFSLLITLLATWYPAYQGSRLNPVEVLKYE